MATIIRKLRPFTVPNYVIEETEPRPKQEGFKEAPKHLLADLEPQTLAQMCDDFRTAVFAKAGMKDPATR
jgi:hypothetical protein